LKKKSKASLSPIPQSGGFSSFLFGAATTLITLIFLIKGSPTLHSSLSHTKNEDHTKATIEWQITPKLKKYFEKKFVEANPDIPENPPDEVNKFSFRDQQAAQPEITKNNPSDLAPKINGSKRSVKIVDASRNIKTPETQSTQRKENKIKSGKINAKVSKPLITSKEETTKSKSTEGFFSKKLMGNKDKENPEKLIASIQNERRESLVSEENNQNQTPQKRPRLSRELIHGPLMKSITSAPRVGTVAIECRLHPYGVYIQKMMQSIEEQWNQLAGGSVQYLQRDRLPSKVTWRFTLMADGSIQNLSRIDNEGESLPSELCRQAIASRVPFGYWSDKMIEDFGKSDEITISFLYK
jgi:hypothetical protein